MNVNETNLIQVGITLADEKGKTPKPVSTWQFNMKFDQTKDPQNTDSIQMLKNAGLDFEKHAKNGIDQYTFARFLKSFKIVENKKLTWVAFNSSFDFGYMIKILSEDSIAQLPDCKYKFL